MESYASFWSSESITIGQEIIPDKTKYLQVSSTEVPTKIVTNEVNSTAVLLSSIQSKLSNTTTTSTKNNITNNVGRFKCTISVFYLMLVLKLSIC